MPHASKLFLAYLEKFSRVAPFYAHPPKLPAVLRVARKLKFPAERRREVAGVLREQNAVFGCGAATQRQLEQLEKGAVAVVTGQQVGLFSGPAYAVYKATLPSVVLHLLLFNEPANLSKNRKTLSPFSALVALTLP